MVGICFAMRRIGRMIAGIALGVTFWGPAPAETFNPPKGPIVLTVQGQIAAHNAQDGLALDADQLAALPQHSFSTSTVWTEGTSVFSGVLLKDFIAAVGAHGTVVTLTALNDYQINIPMAEMADDGPLLALEQDGKPLTARTKGPIWLIYPFDDNPAYRTEETYSRAIWQLDKISFSD